jgi:putative sigma-54 modulation protein
LLDFFGDLRQWLYMKFILSPHNVTLTEAIENHVLSRLEKIEHLDRFVTTARVTLEHDKMKVPERQFSCTIRLSAPGPALVAQDSERDLYAAIDLATKKLEQQLRKRHNKVKATKHTLGARSKRKRQAAEA